MKTQVPSINCGESRCSTFKGTMGVLILTLAGSLFGQTPDTWTGASGVVNNPWSVSGDWNNGTPVMDGNLFFAGTTGLVNTNDISANTEFGGITFNSGSGQFILNGNSITLMNGGGITNNSALVQTNALGSGLAVTNNNITNYITTPGGGQLDIKPAFAWANATVTNDVLIFTGASVKDIDTASTSSFGIGGAAGSVSNVMVLHNSLVDGIGLRRINAANGLANSIILDNSVATNIDGVIVGNGGSSFNNQLVISNNSKVYISGSDLYEVGRNTGSQGNSIIVTGPGSALLSGGHAFAIGGSSGSTTNCSVQVLNGGLWNLGGGTFRLNFSGPQMSLLANSGTITNVYSMIIGNGNYSNSLVLANGSKFNFSAPSGDFRELGRAANANNNTLTITDPNTLWDNGGATLTIGGTASGANNFSNIMTIANGAVFTNGSVTVGGQGSFQTLVISNATAYINSLILNGGNSVVYLNGGSGDSVHLGTLGNNATGVITNTANTIENLVLGWNNGSQTSFPVPVISGLINLTKTGTGTANLQNANIFIGNVIVAGGTLGTGSQQAAVDGSSSAFGCLTNIGKTLIITNGGTLSLGSEFALLNGLDPSTLPPITVYPNSILNSSRFNPLGQITLNGGTLLQNSSDGSPLNGYQFYTTVAVGGAVGSTISVGANGLPDDLYNAVNGGTTFNVANTGSGGADLTVSAPLADYSNGGSAIPGSLTKTGSGIMVLSGTNSSYTGLTTIANGKLVVYSYSLQNGAFTVNDGAALDVTVSGTSQITNTTLTIGNGAGATMEFVGLNSTTVAPVVAPNLTVNGPATINLINATVAAGNQYPLITYTTAGGTGGFVLGATPRGSTMNLVTNNNGNGTFTIALNVTTAGSATTDIWSGAKNANWDINTSSNWTVNASANTYFDGDFVQFTDASSVTNVTLSATVSPGSTTVNSSENYTFISSGGSHISGSGGLVKGGSGTLTLASLANTYTGTNTITGGTVSINSDNNFGATANPVILNGGTLSASTSLTLNSGRSLLLGPASGSGSGTINVAASQTLIYTGGISNNAAGTGSLIKTGAGAASLTGANAYSGSTLVSGGTLSVSTAQQTGGAFTVNDAAGLTVIVSGGATLPVSSLTLGTSGNTTLTLQGISGTNAAITSTSLIANGTVTLSVIGGAVKVGEVPLVKYTTFTGSLANFSLASTLPPNVSAVLTNDTSGKFIGLVIMAINGLAWTGINGPNWDIATTSNWVYGVTGTVYSDGSAVLFNDSGAKNVTITALVSPASMLVSNAGVTYTFTPTSASAGIGGPGGFIKLGAGTMNYASVTNSYAGTTVIGQGQITLGAHPGDLTDPIGSQLLEFSTNNVTITNNAFLQLNGVGGSATVYPQTMSNSITLNNGNIFATDGGQHLAGAIMIGSSGAALGEQQTNKFLFIDGAISGAGNISVPLPNGGVNDGIHTPGGGGYSGPYFTASANPYSGTISSFNGNIGFQDPLGTCLENATFDLEGYNGNLGNPGIWTSNVNHSLTLGGLTGANAAVTFNLTEPVDGWYMSLTVGNSSLSTLVYQGALADTSASATVTKVGSDSQWLVGTNTYSAATIISSGELGVSTWHAGNGSFTVADGASFGVTNTGSSSAAISSLTLGNTGPTTVEFQQVASTTTPLINCAGTLTVNGACTIKITGTNGLSAGNIYPLIASGGISGPGGFTLSIPSPVTANLLTNGTTIELDVTSMGPSVNTNAFALGYSFSGANLTLSWPPDHTGYRLEAQTNSLNVGLSTNWVPLPGSANTNKVIVPIVQTNGSVFYRLIYP